MPRGASCKTAPSRKLLQLVGTPAGKVSKEASQKFREIHCPRQAERIAAPAKFNQGGIIGFKEGRYLDGDTDGMADEKPAMIDGEEPALLSDGEFVIPADVVSHLGNGNSDAGAKVLEEMMARVRKARTGSEEQGAQIDPNDFIPV